MRLPHFICIDRSENSGLVCESNLLYRCAKNLQARGGVPSSCASSLTSQLPIRRATGLENATRRARPENKTLRKTSEKKKSAHLPLPTLSVSLYPWHHVDGCGGDRMFVPPLIFFLVGRVRSASVRICLVRPPACMGSINACWHRLFRVMEHPQLVLHLRFFFHFSFLLVSACCDHLCLLRSGTTQHNTSNLM